ncbi:quinone oxidoreductase PIG3-like [Oscarella lobularis]|uniref:quinone oxidoreductase PIG3-like n=1 Tax=Oscarella lobularis TaxID=121494 RepID=UPI0033142162
MIQIVYDDSGALSAQRNAEIPHPKSNEILIKTVACGVNRLDLLQKAGRYPPPPGESPILGVEVSGIVEKLGEEAQSKCNLKKGDAVCALVGGGGYAGYCAIPWQTAIPVPQGVSIVDAAGIPEVFMTAYSALYWSSSMRQGESILIHAGASGVGLAATQLVKALSGGGKTFITSSSEAKISFCSKIVGGELHGINYKEKDFAEEIVSATGGKGVDVIIDFVGASYWEKNLKSIAVDGRIVLLGLLGGSVTESGLNLGMILRKRVAVVGSTLRARSLEYKRRLTEEIVTKAVPLFEKGLLKPVIDSVYPLEDVQAAHDRMQKNLNSGKILLKF